MSALHNHLLRSLRRAYRRLRSSLGDLEPADAYRGADPNWRSYRYGTGLDGSIAGIVWHVAAWKQQAADGLESGTFPDETTLRPPFEGWAGLLQWLDDGQERLGRALESLPPEELDRPVTWVGVPMTLALLFTHLTDHDYYHDGQINLLRQQAGHVLPEES